ncbi:MAG TPA: PDZ domain-containing protein [Chroococcales cyanobacterium]
MKQEATMPGGQKKPDFLRSRLSRSTSWGILLLCFSETKNRCAQLPSSPLILKAALAALLIGAPCSAMAAHADSSTAQPAGAPQSDGNAGFTGLILKDTKIIGVVPGSPAARAHLVPGDLVISIDGQSTSSLNFMDMIGKVRGAPGTTTVLVIQRGNKQYACSLVRVAANYASNSMAAATAAANMSSAASSAADTGGAPNQPPAIKPDRVDSEMVSIFRKTEDTPTVYDNVISALHMVPLPLKEALNQWGLKIVIAPTILTPHPDQAREKPGTYIHGGCYDNCPAFFRSIDKTIYIAERASRGNSPAELTHGSKQSTLHEFGHAFDYFSNATRSDDFIRTAEEDNQRLPNGERSRYYYFTETATANRELFAELFAVSILASGGEAGRSDGMRAAFPRAYADVTKRIAQWRR